MGERDDESQRYKYTGQKTWFKRVAGVIRPLFQPFFADRPAEIQEELAPDRLCYPLALERYLRRVKLPGEGGLTEYERLKSNAIMFQECLTTARQEITSEALNREWEAQRIEEARLQAQRIAEWVCGACGKDNLPGDTTCRCCGRFGSVVRQS